MINLDDNLTSGQSYSFTFQLQDLLLGPDPSTIISDLDQYAPGFIANPVANYAAKPGLFQGSYLVVTFTYSGDGSDVVSDVANGMISAFKQGSWYSPNFSLVQADLGTVSTVQGGTAPPNSYNPANELGGLPSGSSLWAIAAIGLLVVFVLSGGPSITKGAFSK